MKIYKIKKFSIKLFYYKPVKLTILNFFFNTGFFYLLKKTFFIINFSDVINHFSLKGAVLNFKINYLRLKETKIFFEVFFLFCNLIFFFCIYFIIFNFLISIFLFFF